jgi:flavin reductase (DIM6/NTAB) family NADH-FMN oxidoreductase RutF
MPYLWNPPLVLFSINRAAYSLQHLLFAERFGISVLRADQSDISNRFAHAQAEKWTEFKPAITDSGCPVIHPSLATFECKLFATYEGGDHLIIVARVERYEAAPEGAPLVFFRGRYHTLASSAA